MADPIFRIRNPKAKTKQPITLILRYKNNGKFTHPTGHKVLPSHWNPSTYRVRNLVEVTDKDDINNTLSSFVSAAEKALSELISERVELSNEVIRKRFLKILDDQKESEKETTLFDFIDTFIDRSKKRVNQQTGEHLDATTIGKYINTRKRLKEFKKLYRPKTDLGFDDIDLEFYDDFVDFLTNFKQYAVNTVGKYIKTLKEFLKAATEEGVNKKLDYLSPKFKTLTELTDTIYLTEKELNLMFAYDFSGNPRLEKARDLFMVGAWTGLRFSDFSCIRKEHIRPDNFICIEQEKSNGKVVIPIHPILASILKKYEGQPPKTITNQNLNDYIKEVGEVVGLSTPVIISKTKGGKRISKTYKKYELITTHTARRSFATNLFKSGFPAISIMKITGHKTEKSFLRYIRLSNDEHAKMLELHWQKNLNQTA